MGDVVPLSLGVISILRHARIKERLRVAAREARACMPTPVNILEDMLELARSGQLATLMITAERVDGLCVHVELEIADEDCCDTIEDEPA